MRSTDSFSPGKVTGVLLVGGRSRRMGADKARLTLDGESFLAILGARLFGMFGSLRVVGGPAEIHAAEAGIAEVAQPESGARAYAWVPDGWADGGPLAGLCAGLAAADTPEVFAAGCDMPLLDPDVVRALYPEGGLREDVRVLRSAGRTHPLHAFYRVACLPRLTQAFLRGTRSLKDALAVLDVVETTVPESLAEAAERSCGNVNTPAELERLRGLARQ